MINQTKAHSQHNTSGYLTLSSSEFLSETLFVTHQRPGFRLKKWIASERKRRHLRQVLTLTSCRPLNRVCQTIVWWRKRLIPDLTWVSLVAPFSYHLDLKISSGTTAWVTASLSCFTFASFVVCKTLACKSRKINRFLRGGGDCTHYMGASRLLTSTVSATQISG